MKKYFFLLLWIIVVGCAHNYGQLTYVTKLPHKLTENSGIVPSKDSTLWFVMDRGNPDKIYQVNYEGDLLKELKVKNAKNHDWEDLASDGDNVYIGDFGNNGNDRKNLAIYKIPNPDAATGDDIEATKIEFNYPEQKDFPPKKKKLLFDAEAFFYYQNNFYIVTKNRTHPFNGEALLYKVPAIEGKHEAQYLGSFFPPKGKINGQVTSADISPDGKTIVLLGNGTLWVFTDFTMDNFLSTGTLKTIDLGVYTQLESVSFTNNNTLLLSDEESGKTGRNLYSFVLGN
ncbi:hypothetical protein MWU78_11505 [Arenibacter sp. F26102]|uniref:hypothetical protein n=1 Tax=Arenibacter sp. F26102 TaxID=2926416 RepID=UPI001FF20F50|nr:hypothetical protein [Arenibacter sp. F26102]MCK0146271.1 hypothetical protein [Arenibacter sp. F26102]